MCWQSQITKSHKAQTHCIDKYNKIYPSPLVNNSSVDRSVWYCFKRIAIWVLFFNVKYIQLFANFQVNLPYNVIMTEVHILNSYKNSLLQCFPNSYCDTSIENATTFNSNIQIGLFLHVSQGGATHNERPLPHWQIVFTCACNTGRPWTLHCDGWRQLYQQVTSHTKACAALQDNSP